MATVVITLLLLAMAACSAGIAWTRPVASLREDGLRLLLLTRSAEKLGKYGTRDRRWIRPAPDAAERIPAVAIRFFLPTKLDAAVHPGSGAFSFRLFPVWSPPRERKSPLGDDRSDQHRGLACAC